MNETKKRQKKGECHNKTYNNKTYNIKYDTRILNKITRTNDVQEQKEKITKTKWAKFRYVGQQTKFITQLFKSSSLKVSFKTENTIGKLLAQNKNINQNII